MAPAKCSFESDVVPLVRSLAKRTFEGDRDRVEKTHDALSQAWVFWQNAPIGATPMSLAWYSVKRVKSGRQFPEKERSITGPNPRRLYKPRRGDAVRLLDLSGKRDDPGEVAAMRIDFPQWFQSLTPRQQTVCMAVLLGDTTLEIAEALGVTPPAISQTRRKLRENWLSYTA